jgi:hypothetical protein
MRHFAAAAAAVALLTSCSTNHAGTAAIVDGQVITAAQVGDRVNEVRAEIQKLPAGAVQSVPSVVDLNGMVVNQLLFEAVVEKVATAAGLNVTDAQVNTMRDTLYQQYGEDQFKIILSTQYGVSSGQIETFLHAVYVRDSLGKLLAPTGDSQARATASMTLIGKASAAMHISVSPRFGAWNPNNAQVLAGDNILSLAAPKV